MKLTIPTKSLLTALTSLKSVAKPATTHPILSNIRLTATTDSVELMGMDLEKQLAIKLDCKVSEPGSTTINCTRLHALLSTRREQECSIATDEKHVSTVKCGQSVTKMPGLSPDEWPPMIETKDGIEITLDAKTFSDALTKSLVFASLDKSRMILNSVFLVSRRGNLNIQATDGRRMVIFDTTTTLDSKESYIIPRESVPTIAAMCVAGNVTLTLSEGSLTASTGEQSLSTKLIEGSMGDFEKHFQKKEERTGKVIANREELLSEIDSAGTQVSELSKSISFECDGKSITVSARSKDEGSITNRMECKSGSSAIKFGVSPSYFRDALKTIESEDVELEIKSDVDPIVIADGAVTMCVMPMRVA